MSEKSSAIAYAVSAALAGSYSPGTLAQDATADLEAVVVTARKREETLLEIPQEVQVISQQEMERANLRTSQDLERFIPSLSTNSNDAGLVSIFFRGVAEGTAGGVADSSAAIYLDEQPLTMKAWSPEVRLIDIERVEALPGPQGTLYGASSQSGTLRYITNKPDPAGFHAHLRLDGYTADHGDEGYELSGVLNLPLGEKAAIRLVGFSARDAGYIDNVLGESLGGTFNNADAVEKDANAVEYQGGRAALQWLAGENWTVDLGVVRQELDAGDFSDEDVGRFGRELASVIFQGAVHSDDWTQFALTLRGDLRWGELTSATSYFKRDISDLRDSTDWAFLDSYYMSDPASCAVQPTIFDCAFALGPDPKSHAVTEGNLDWFTQEFRLRGATEMTTWLRDSSRRVASGELAPWADPSAPTQVVATERRRPDALAGRVVDGVCYGGRHGGACGLADAAHFAPPAMLPGCRAATAQRRQSQPQSRAGIAAKELHE